MMQQNMQQNQLLQFVKTNATLIALVVLTVALALADPTFHTARNLSNVARQVTIVGIIAVGMTMVILIAGIDLSVGSVVGVAAVVVTLLMQYGLAAWIAVPVALVIVGGVIGLWNGFWIAHYRIPPFIITLGMLTIGRGVALTLSGGSSVPVADPSFAKIGGAYIPPMPTLVILAIAAALYVYSLSRASAKARNRAAAGTSTDWRRGSSSLQSALRSRFTFSAGEMAFPFRWRSLSSSQARRSSFLAIRGLADVFTRSAATRKRRACRASTSIRPR